MKTIYMLEYMNAIYMSLKTKEQQVEFLSQFEQKQTKDDITYFILKEDIVIEKSVI